MSASEKVSLAVQCFGPDATPKRTIAPRRLHPSLPGHFPTSKAAGGLLRTRSPLMMDGLIHAATDPLAVRIAAYPLEIHWWCKGANGVYRRRSDIPDIAVGWRDGSLSFHSFTPLEIQKENPRFAEQEEQLDRVFREEHGASYSVLDERDIHVQPRHMNLVTMWKHELGDLDPEAIDAVRLALERRRRAGDPSTIGQLKADCDLLPFWTVFAHEAPPQPLAGNDRVFSAVMTLAIAGEISLDLGKTLSDKTSVGPGVLTTIRRVA